MNEHEGWLMDPGVELRGMVGRDYTFVTDGVTGRVRKRPRPGMTPADMYGSGSTWEAQKSEAHSPWLTTLPVALGPNQTLITDGVTRRVKDKPVPQFGAIENEEEVVFEPPTTTTGAPTTTTTTTPPPTPPPTTTTPPPTPPPTTTPPPATTTPPPVTTQPPVTTPAPGTTQPP